MKFLRDHALKYEDLLRRSLQAADFTGTTRATPEQLVVETTLPTPAVVFLRISRR